MIFGENIKLGIREIISALRAETQWMNLVRDDGKAYSKLIDFLNEEWSSQKDSDDFNWKDYTVTRYAKCLGEKSATINKWLRQIYEDIFVLNEKHPELFVKHGEYLCSFDYSSPYKQYGGFWFQLGVRTIPRVGDRFSFYFMRPVAYFTDYDILEVTHRYENGKMWIEINLGLHVWHNNSYRKLLIDKARYLGYLSYNTLDSDYDINTKVKSTFIGNESAFI